jgi:hypothetical protein
VVETTSGSSPLVRFSTRHSRKDWDAAVDCVIVLRAEGGRNIVYGRYRLTFDAGGQATLTEVGGE